MKIKNKMTYKALLIITGLIFFISCKKESQTILPSLTTTPAIISGNTAIIGGNIISDGGAEILRKGICFNTSPNPNFDNNKVMIDTIGSGNFTASIFGLNNNTTYYARAYAENILGISYGNEVTFTTSIYGSLDASFNPGSGADNIVLSVAIQSDGKIIIGGDFSFYNGTARNGIARLNSDGSLDASFNPGSGTGTDYVETLAIQSDGKIIIGGNFTSYNGTARNHIARLNSDGSLDVSFNPGSGTDFDIYTSAIQIDGKIIIGGNFTSYNGTPRNRIARLNSDGSLDVSFNPGSGADANVYTIAIQSDGKIIVGGHFSSYNGTARNYIARLNSDGSLDVSFNPGAGADNLVYTAAIQSDGKIIIGGDFTSYNGTARNCITRLNSNGSLDASFNPGSGANALVRTIDLQSDGKIIVGGDFTSYNGMARNHIARLNSNGSLDASFNTGSGPSNGVNTSAIQSDGKIIIGGFFTTCNGTVRNYIARIF